MSSAQTSHLLPTYARVDLAFERGEGAWQDSNRMVNFEGAIPRRTVGTLAAWGQKNYLCGFGAVVGGFDLIALADLGAPKRAVGPGTAVIMIESIMGEGGVRVVAPEF